MQIKSIDFNKKFDISPPYIRLLIIIFIAAVLAKGTIIFRGYAIDDYSYISGVSSQTFQQIFSQERYITAAIMWFVDSIGANMNDLYFSLGIANLFLQAVFVVTVLRFVGMEDSPTASLVGAIIVAHPYLTEILTFRVALPIYSVALIFSTVALEMLIKNTASWVTRTFALLATLAMLFTYQIFLNYFAVAIIFAFIYGQVLHRKNDQSLLTNNVYQGRAVTLAIISLASLIFYLIITALVKRSGLTAGISRASLISFDKIPERMEQISSFLLKIYWSDEPIFQGWLKTFVALMLSISLAIIFFYLLSSKRKTNSIRDAFCTFFAFLLLIPISLGVILPFQDWWPVPRVVSHVAMIIGFIFLVADSCMSESRSRFLKSIVFASRTIVLVGFIFLSNQILADQQRLNQWDNMMANRIISRLETFPNFRNVHSVYINGGSWGFPAKLRTIQGDMNVSAFFPAYSKVPLLAEVSGYWLHKAEGSKVVVGDAYCKDRQPWPHLESVTVDDDMAIICLKK